MRYLALATDYDGTVTTRTDRIDDRAERALRKLRQSGRRIILVTGRTYDQLAHDLPDMGLFDAVVLENGGVIYWPATRETTILHTPPPRGPIVDRLATAGVFPIIQGHVVIATVRPHEMAVLDTVRALGLELQIVFNGDSVMLLPSGVNKASGLRQALRRMGLSLHEVVGIGNAANDHSFLDACECSVAVADAVPALKTKVDFVTTAPAGAGVAELIEELVGTDLTGRSPRGPGDVLVLAKGQDGTALTFRPYGQNIMITGPSGAGKSTFATGLIERLVDRKYQICIIDPEGDYSTLGDIVTLGSRLRAPHVDEILDVLGDASVNVVVNLLGVSMADRPAFFAELLLQIQALRARTGRPHWLLIDEVHHLLPAPWGLAPATLPQRLGETILITYRPGEVAPPVLSLVDTVVAVGPGPESSLAEFAAALRLPAPRPPRDRPTRDEVAVWQRSACLDPVLATIVPARAERLRHLRKYAEGNLGWKSFIFRGPERKMRLRAQNLVGFCELASGVDEETWSFHLRAGDYSRWMREVIKDDDLAREVEGVETSDMAPADSVRLIRDAVERRYVLQS